MSEADTYPDPKTFRAYKNRERDVRDEHDREARAATRERALVQWVHELGRALRRLHEVSGLSDDQLVEALGDPTDDLKHLAEGFSDRVQVGDLKSFVDACGGFLDIVVYDKDGQIVSARELAPIGRSAPGPTRGSAPASALDEEALTERVTTNVIRRLALAFESTLATSLKEGNQMSSYGLQEDPAVFGVDEDPA